MCEMCEMCENNVVVLQKQLPIDVVVLVLSKLEKFHDVANAQFVSKTFYRASLRLIREADKRYFVCLCRSVGGFFKIKTHEPSVASFGKALLGSFSVKDRKMDDFEHICEAYCWNNKNIMKRRIRCNNSINVNILDRTSCEYLFYGYRKHSYCNFIENDESKYEYGASKRILRVSCYLEDLEHLHVIQCIGVSNKQRSSDKFKLFIFGNKQRNIRQIIKGIL